MLCALHELELTQSFLSSPQQPTKDRHACIKATIAKIKRSRKYVPIPLHVPLNNVTKLNQQMKSDILVVSVVGEVKIYGLSRGSSTILLRCCSHSNKEKAAILGLHWFRRSAIARY